MTLCWNVPLSGPFSIYSPVSYPGNVEPLS